MTTFRVKIFPSILMALLTLAALTSCGTPEVTAPAPGPKTLLVGMDGLEWRVLLPMLKAGELPTFEGVMRSGVYGKLTTLKPTASPIIWTSVATGKKPAHHGIFGKTIKNEAGEHVRSFYSTDRTTKAVWNIFSDFGKKTHSIGWWITYPAEEISGVMVAQLNNLFKFNNAGRGDFIDGPRHSTQEQVHPAGFLDTVLADASEANAGLDARELEIFDQFPHPHSELGERLWAKVHWAITLDASHHKIARRLMDSGDPFDLMLVYFRGSDVLAHNFWRFTYPEAFDKQPTRNEIENYSELIPDYYRHLDAVLADLIEAAGEDTTLLIMSDHGMTTRNTDSAYDVNGMQNMILSGGHRQAPPSVFMASGPRIAAGSGAGLALDAIQYSEIEILGSVFDVTPTLLALNKLPAGDDMDGDLLAGVIDAGFLQDHPLRKVPSLDTPGWRDNIGDLDLDEDEARDRLEELRSLGYIE